VADLHLAGAAQHRLEFAERGSRARLDRHAQLFSRGGIELCLRPTPVLRFQTLPCAVQP
jgi:hypothetical protein